MRPEPVARGGGAERDALSPRRHSRTRGLPIRGFAGILLAILLTLRPAGAPSRVAAEEVATGDAAARPAEAAALAVVVPRAFLPALEAYLAHRRADLPVETAVLEEVLQGAGADDPERLKRWLHAAWQDRSVRYALLVGDAGVLPVRYMTLDRVHPPAFDTAFYPSDLYYADVARADGSFDDWNGNREGHHAGYFGEVHGEHHKDPPMNFDGIHYLPELAVGRWPVRTAEEAAIVAAKTIAFERALLSERGEAGDPAPGPGFGSAGRRVVFAVGGGWVDARGRFDRLQAELGEGWSAERLYYRDAGKESDLPLPVEAEIVARVRAGCSFVFHAGHGLENGWEGCLSTDSVARMEGAPLTPIFFSAGCSTAHFSTLAPYDAYRDVEGKEHEGTNRGEVFRSPPPAPAPYQPEPYDRTGIGEFLVRGGPRGAVAYIGCNTGSQPCGLTLVDGFVRALARADRSTRLGDLWCRAIRHYHAQERLDELVPTADWYPASIFFQGMKFMLFGDPSLRLPPA